MSQKITVICVTENRTEFMPWLAFVYNSQTYKNKQLLVIDSSPIETAVENQKILGDLLPGSELIYHRYGHPRCLIAEKRNRGLDMASEPLNSPLITWLDDDDWKAPAAIERGIEALGERSVVSVRLKFPFINLHNMKCRYVPTYMWSLGIYRTGAIKDVRFQDKGSKGHPMLVGEDTTWQGHVWQKVPQTDQVRLHEGTGWFGCALTHTRNIANGVWKPLFWKYPVPDPPDSVSAGQWTRVLEEIGKLKGRLGIK